ncbi:hypothetical protein OIDMADRAFT_18031 [Oidiodendron maius Zn]|uniref:STE24 endopeptidase n=1 Tax=Oidiodendron maius (strain Zn) TaxID=913774 RepID=A0A0C3CXP5_OIDMZ|nr:hypothetical protein OIDMADRAFT_18031 [Oidiodendron maius Zn]
MPTPLDKAMNSKNAFLGFSAVVTAVAVWTIWGPGDIFPREADPSGDPEMWTREEMRRWLAARNLHPHSKDTRDQLLERIQSNLRIPRS